MASWPASLPDYVLVDGYEESAPNTLVRTQMDKGPDKVRRRYTAGVRTFAAQLELDGTQVETFDTFAITTLEGGALSFDWVHPRTQSNVSFRMVPVNKDALYRVNALGGDYFRVQFQLEILP